MEALQGVVDMQLLAIEKTLRAADAFAHADMGAEIEDSITRVSKQLVGLMCKIQQKGAVKDPKGVGRNPRKPSKVRCFSIDTTGSSPRRNMSALITPSAHEYALFRFERSLRCIVRERKRAAFALWSRVVADVPTHTNNSFEWSRSQTLNHDDLSFQSVSSEASVDAGPATFSPSIFSAHDGQPVSMHDMDRDFYAALGATMHSTSSAQNSPLRASVYPSNTVITADSFLHTATTAERSLPLFRPHSPALSIEAAAPPQRALEAGTSSPADSVDELYAELMGEADGRVRGRTSRSARGQRPSQQPSRGADQTQAMVQSTRFLQMMPEASPSWERHLQWNAGLSEGVEMSP